MTQLQKAVDQILRHHSQIASHDYDKDYLLIEIDMTRRPCGRKAEFASKGYFAKQRNRRGRQDDYVVASQYEETMLKSIYDGTTQLNTAFRPLFGIMRMVRDVLHITGIVSSDEHRNVRKNVLNSADPFAKHIYPGLAGLLVREQVVVCLGEI